MKQTCVILTISIAFSGMASAAGKTIDDFVRAIDPQLTPENAAVAGVFGKTTDGLRDPGSLEISEVFTKVTPQSAVGYRAGCSASRDLAPSNRVQFPTEASAVKAGFRRSAVPGC